MDVTVKELGEGNFLFSSGRVGFPDSRSGQAISPLDKEFSQHLERKIRPVVLALIRKGFRTIESCSGHDGSTTSIVTLAFPSQRQHDEAIKEFLKFPNLAFKPNFKFENQNIPRKDYAPYREREAALVNCLYALSHPEWSILQIRFPDFNLWTKLKFIWFVRRISTRRADLLNTTVQLSDKDWLQFYLA